MQFQLLNRMLTRWFLPLCVTIFCVKYQIMRGENVEFHESLQSFVMCHEENSKSEFQILTDPQEASGHFLIDFGTENWQCKALNLNENPPTNTLFEVATCLKINNGIVEKELIFKFGGWLNELTAHESSSPDNNMNYQCLQPD